MTLRSVSMSPNLFERHKTLPGENVQDYFNDAVVMVEPVDEQRHLRFEKPDLAPFTKLLKKYNVTGEKSFSKCYGPSAQTNSPAQDEALPCVDISQHRQQKSCEDVLLVMFFNPPHYSSIPFLRRVYTPLFGDRILFCGRREPSELPRGFPDQTRVSI